MESHDRGPSAATYDGAGETFEEALHDAATSAVEHTRDNVGRRFEVVRHTVTVDNPRISQHRVTISAT